MGAARSFVADSVLSRLRSSGGVLGESPAQVKCITVIDRSFQPQSELTCKVRIDRYTWKSSFLVVRDLAHPVILGADFLTETGLLTDLSHGLCFFRFDPSNKLPLVGRNNIIILPSTSRYPMRSLPFRPCN